jgi:hypothetical protein
VEIGEVISGNVYGEWGLYIRDLNGNWHLADVFIVDDDHTCATLSLEGPVSFDAWTCPCLVLGDSWNFYLSMWLENADVFVYGN